MQNNDVAGRKNFFIKFMQQRILSGALRPGDKLKPERELAQELGISRGSVNQGVLDLERMGFLRVVPRHGTFVAQYKQNATPMTLSAILSYDSALIDPALFKSLMEMRILIERECVRLTCCNIDAAGKRKLLNCCKTLHESSGTDLVDTLYNYHLCIVHLSENAAYAIIFQGFEKLLKNLMQMHYSSPVEVSNNLPLYDALSDSISKRDAANADTLICKVLSIASEYLKQHLK